MRFYDDGRLGLFVHWGVYAVGGLHEQELWRYRGSKQEYDKYLDKFNPESFDPKRWIDVAKQWGASYLIFTTKHHDGFCMWDSPSCSYNIMQTPYKKDILKMIADECHRQNFPLVIYYSVVDWHQKSYPNIDRHHEIETDKAWHNEQEYIDYVKTQVTELCTKYGKIHGFWWDMNVAEWEDSSVNELIRSHQPHILINNRGLDTGDFSTPERAHGESEFQPFTSKTEGCNSISAVSWGYRVEDDFFSTRFLKNQIAQNIARGGNFVINFGPNTQGDFSCKAYSILSNIGEWYNTVKEGLSGTPVVNVVREGDVLATYSENSLYLIFLNGWNQTAFRLGEFPQEPYEAILMNDGRKLDLTYLDSPYEVREGKRILRIRNLPVEDFYNTVPVVALKFKNLDINKFINLAQDDEAKKLANNL